MTFESHITSTRTTNIQYSLSHCCKRDPNHLCQPYCWFNAISLSISMRQSGNRQPNKYIRRPFRSFHTWMTNALGKQIWWLYNYIWCPLMLAATNTAINTISLINSTNNIGKYSARAYHTQHTHTQTIRNWNIHVLLELYVKIHQPQTTHT